jgi:hypothetical protein
VQTARQTRTELGHKLVLEVRFAKSFAKQAIWPDISSPCGHRAGCEGLGRPTEESRGSTGWRNLLGSLPGGELPACGCPPADPQRGAERVAAGGLPIVAGPPSDSTHPEGVNDEARNDGGGAILP